MSELGWSGVCKHGWYETECPQCKMEAEIARLQAIIDEQRKQNEDWQQEILTQSEEIERLTTLVEKLQAGNRAEALAAARLLYREGQFDGTPIGAEILKSHPWLKEREGEG